MTTADKETVIVSHPWRIGLIVPSSNTTIETELPEMFRRQSESGGPAFTFHSSRAVLRSVDAESLRKMVEQVDRCSRELADAYVHACLVALMAHGPVAYIEAAGVTVVDAMSLRVSDNLEVGRLDPAQLPDLAEQLDTSNADGIVISACVQMPSLPAISEVERRLDMPVLSAASASAWEVLVKLGLQPAVPGGGALLDPQAVGARLLGAAG